MVELRQGDVWWADVSEPSGSAPGFRRPVLVIQGNPFNESAIATAVCVVLTSNLKWAAAPGTVLLKKKATGLPKDSVANVSQVVTLDTSDFTERCGRISGSLLQQVFHGLGVMMNR